MSPAAVTTDNAQANSDALVRSDKRVARTRRRPPVLWALGLLTALALTGTTVHLLDARSVTPDSFPGTRSVGLAPAIGASQAASGGGAFAPLSVTSGVVSAPAASPATPLVVGSPPSSTIERSVTAEYTVPPGGFLAAFQEVISRAVGLGGYVVSSSTTPDGTGRIVSGGVTLKVPAAKIADLLNGMPSSFAASAINFGSVDHTAAFVDVNARLGSARAHLAALNALVAKATNLGDITGLEQQVEGVQTEIDTDQGQLNVLQASVGFSTATIQLGERGAAGTTPPRPGPVAGGVADGWSNAAAVTGAVLEGAVTASPIILLALALGALTWCGSRWSRRRRDAAFGV